MPSGCWGNQISPLLILALPVQPIHLISHSREVHHPKLPDEPRVTGDDCTQGHLRQSDVAHQAEGTPRRLQPDERRVEWPGVSSPDLVPRCTGWDVNASVTVRCSRRGAICTDALIPGVHHTKSPVQISDIVYDGPGNDIVYDDSEYLILVNTRSPR